MGHFACLQRGSYISTSCSARPPLARLGSASTARAGGQRAASPHSVCKHAPPLGPLHLAPALASSSFAWLGLLVCLPAGCAGSLPTSTVPAGRAVLWKLDQSPSRLNPSRVANGITVKFQLPAGAHRTPRRQGRGLPHWLPGLALPQHPGLLPCPPHTKLCPHLWALARLLLGSFPHRSECWIFVMLGVLKAQRSPREKGLPARPYLQ